MLQNSWTKIMIICVVYLESQAQLGLNFILNIQDSIFPNNLGMRWTKPIVSLKQNGQLRRQESMDAISHQPSKWEDL